MSQTFPRACLRLLVASVVAISAVLLQSSFAAAVGAAPPVVRGAEWVSPPSTPSMLTVDMRRLPTAARWRPGDPIVEIPRGFFPRAATPVPTPRSTVRGQDPLVDRQLAYGVRAIDAFGTPLLNFDTLAPAGVSPHDPTGDIGPLQFVAASNAPGGAQFAVFDKTTGTQIVAPTVMDTLGAGGACSNGLGDPVVLFDEMANRWLLTEFTSGANVLCVYVSDSADLSGVVTWSRYSFTLPGFPDYPKFGIWPDAYYVGANENNAVYAMDRQKILAGQAATLQRFTIAQLAGFDFQMAQPADLAGTDQPPVGAPGIFMRHRDDEVHNPGTNNPTSDFLEMFEFHVDWVTPANSAITGPISFSISEISSELNGLTSLSAFAQPNSAPSFNLDSVREVVMHRVTYRNLGTYEALVGNLVTDLCLDSVAPFDCPTYPNDTGAVRWFELRRPIGPADRYFADGFETVTRAAAPTWALYQEGTYAPADGAVADQADRWMAATSIDSAGNIALGYNIVRQAPAISAGLRYTGRLVTDPPGVMTAGEHPIIEGSGSIQNNRWGDYSDMGVDPIDGCTFWFIGNYSNGGVRANRAANFRFGACGGPSFTLTSPAPAAAVCANSAAPINATPITINVAAVNAFVGAVNLSYLPGLPAGLSGTLTPPSLAAFPGSATAQLTATNAATPGINTVFVSGNSGAIVRNLQISLTVATGTPPAPTLITPANTATGIGSTPLFSWSAAAQASSYLVQASTSPSFASVLFSQTVTGTSLVAPVALPSNQQIYWRVRAINVCGSVDSAVSSYNGPAFNMVATPNTVSVCASTVAPANAPPVTLDLTAVNGFVGSVALSYPNPLPTGIAGSLTPSSLPSVPGNSVAQLSATNATTPGSANILARGISGAITRDVVLTLNVATGAAPAPALSAPVDGAINVTTTPTFAWAASSQAGSYVVEASTSNTFASTLFSQTTSATALLSPVTLPTDTQIYWRVRADNVCGSTSSAVFTFVTAPAPGDCPAGAAPTIVASEDFEGAATGWVQEVGGTGTNTWAITTAFPFAGAKALRGLTPSTASDQRFVSPAFNLPSVGNGLTLSFQSRQQMESHTGGCYDGGLIEVSVGGGPYTQITTGLLTDPYDGPLDPANPATPALAWCGDPQSYLKSVIDLAPYAGLNNVRFRFRVTSDTLIGRADGWNIDNVEIKRCN